MNEEMIRRWAEVNEEMIRRWAEVFSALASEPRLRIVAMLRGGTMLRGGKIECQEILERLDLSQPAVSYHLGKLEHAGVLKKERSGSRNCYRLSEGISELVDIMIEKEDG